MPRVYMIRHGKPASTWGDHVADADPGLDETGQEQAKAARDALLALPAEVRPTLVLSSPLRRCRETAEPFARALGLEPVIIEAVAEIPTPASLSPEDRGPWLRDAFTRTWSEVKGDIDYRLWRDRAGAAVASHPRAAIFSHYVAINAAVSVATGSEAVLSFQPDHCSITVFEIEGGVLKLVELGRAAVTRVL